MNSSKAWAWHHTGLAVSDLNKSIAFYQKTFGYRPVFEALDMSDLIQSVTGIAGLRADLVQLKSDISDQILELIRFRNIPAQYDQAVPIAPGRAHNAFLVPDLDLAIAQAERMGGRQLGKITEFSEGKAVYMVDADCNAFELEMASPEVLN